MFEAREVTRITLLLPSRQEAKATALLEEHGVRVILAENARSVRQRLRPRGWGLPGYVSGLEIDALQILRTTVARGSASPILRSISRELDLSSPGQGQMYSQYLLEYSRLEAPRLVEEQDGSFAGFRDLALITGILSRTGSGDALAQVALGLGAGVPVISRGLGTGIRDRLGLLRITIPPEKEYVHLLVPAQDSGGLLRMLIEEGRLNQPGGGFLYVTPVRMGVVDSLVRVGRQEHAASLEQIIAAVDEIKQSTSWRKRFAGIGETRSEISGLRRNQREITFICAEGGGEQFVAAAMRAGAGGATTSRVRCHGGGGEGGVAARERGVLIVPGVLCDAVLRSLWEAGVASGDEVFRLQVMDAPAVYTHQKGRS